MNTEKTTVDWLRFRTKAGVPEVLHALKPMFHHPAHGLRLEPLQRGILGFQRGAQIMLADMPVGRLDYGGESQRDWVRVDIPGKGCEWVTHWDFIDAIEGLPNAEIRRLDVALTTWQGEVTHERVVQAHADGRFVLRRPPSMRQIISSDSKAGRTCEIGTREKSDKFMRCYEKGRELASKACARTGLYVTHIEGCPVEDIYRCEVEFKASSTEIPWEVVERRDQYFAGAYPFCADVLPGVEADILKRRPEREPQMDLQAALENCRIQYGPTLFTALHAYHGDIHAVWEKVLGSAHNPSLLEAGVLLVDHD